MMRIRILGSGGAGSSSFIEITPSDWFAYELNGWLSTKKQKFQHSNCFSAKTIIRRQTRNKI